ncbi:bifunctional enoyl-CoA hydratase/phosphate acetyltransferase [Sporohalobacter salinus]|uniref:bifunctional enoyl-CoA hydratase/phosphate acetyltransferase n=1 Tax=Sporohalobacter salinus TaxID=1494606 RepID=UPI0019608402|nr:bifunctional enoyl-CoA hydratase/phosphate acetyltransferase [Sporohalobacter salinus]MBM7624417.1 phosphate butyryltransferase [Sporohalobacter salinus]
MLNNFNQLINLAQKKKKLRLAVAAAEDPVVLSSIKQAVELELIDPILIGDSEKIEKQTEEIGYKPNKIVGTNSKLESAQTAMSLIAKGESDYPMKGLLSSKTILRALLDKEYGLRRNRLLSVVTLINLEQQNRMIIMTDGGMNIAPDLEEKIQIIENAVEIARALGIEKAKVAALAAVEDVNPKMPVTKEAATLAKMSDRDQIEGAIVDGPLALDNAISKEAAKHKGIDSPVAGEADILLVPNIEVGNVLYKSLVFYAGHDSASLVMGAKVPLVFTSRADKTMTKFHSILLGKMAALDILD